jgi:hypothetical protein
MALGLWGGLVAAEMVVELRSRTPEEMRHAAALHYWIDVLLELPLLAAVLVTGAVLVASAWPLTPLHWVKVGAGLLAIAANLWCVGHVLRRNRTASDAAALARHARWVRVTAAFGLPFGAIALYLGLAYFAR